VAALEAALALRELATGLVDVELVAPEPAFWYRPVAVAEPFGLGEVRHFDLADLATAAGALFTLAALEAVDVDAHEARLSTGAVVPYDALLLACGGVPTPAVPGALTFRGPVDGDAFGRVLRELEDGSVRRLAFVVPWGTTWVLPAYELALMTALWAERRGLDVQLSLVTPEEEPLELFGPAASQAIHELLDDRAIALHPRSAAVELRDASLRLLPEGELPTERVVALPEIRGQRIDGLTQSLEGFVSTDAHGRVLGVDGVYAAGDITAFPVKQGGLAAQQAEAAAEWIAADAGAGLTPRAFDPILRGLLLTGSHPRYLRRDLATGEASSWVSETPIWWPPTKLVGRRLSPFLAELSGSRVLPDEPPPGLDVEIALGPEEIGRLVASRHGAPAGHADSDDDGPRVGELMAHEPLVVEPEDTLGEVAERMRATGSGTALVTEYGRLIGILTPRDLLGALAGRTHSSEARVRHWMTVDPVVVSADATATEARLLMTRHGVHRLPVVEGGRAVGVIGLRAVTAAASPAIGLGL
jgi:sulfide:quinone oxidoreductase